MRSSACIGGEKRLDSVQPSNCMGNGSAMRASVLLSLTGKDGNDGNLHRKTISDFTLQSSDGQTISLSSLRGQKVLLYFFTSPGGGN